MKYYYLVASLVSLKFGAKPPITTQIFIEECEKWLLPSDFKAISSVSIEYSESVPEDTALITAWKDFNKELKTVLMYIRLARKKNEVYKGQEELKTVFTLETPLVMERKIEEMRWNFLDDKETAFFFDINSLIIYFLKLQILERLARFDKDEGDKFFYELSKIKDFSYGEAIR